jgi:predicted anti-sigma-YlaC factor YlaD
MAQTPETYEELSCQELVELVTDYFEGALPAELLATFERHVEECSGCRTYLEQMRRTIEATGRLTPDEITPEAEAALLEAFRGWRS